MLGLDALEDTRPRLLAIVGTRTATADPTPFYRGRERVVSALRKRFGRGVEYASLCEFTTGKGAHSGGQRRPHWNVFLKGIDPDNVALSRAIVREVWCRYVDADPQAQYVEVLRDAGAAATYVAHHFHKRDQAPPAGWTGQRFNSSRGYYPGRTRAEMRALARADLRREMTRWKVAQQDPELSGDTIADVAEQLLWRDDARSWSMVSVSPARAERLVAALPAAQRVRTPAEGT